MRGFKSSDKSSSEKSIGENMSSTSFAQPSSAPTSNGANGHLSTAQPAPATKPQTTPSAIIGPKIRFKGELVGEEDLLIQGQVEGTIDLKNNTLTIGEQGIVKANVVAKTVTIQGTVEGDLFGQERISILASSNVKGNVVADRVTLEDGAKFRGSIDMDIGAHKDKFQKAGTSVPPPAAMANKPAGNPQDNKDSN